MYKSFKPKNLKEEFPFLSEVSSQAICQAENDLNTAYKNFFKSAAGTRKGKMGFPKRKSKRNARQSYRECMVSPTALNFFSKYVKIPKVGKVAFSHDSLPKWFSNKIKLCNITVEKSSAGRYYAILLYEILPCVYEVENRKAIVGLDFSPSEMYVSSENQTGKDFGYVAQKQAHSKKLKKLQQNVSRKLYRPFYEKFGRMPNFKSPKDRIAFKELNKVQSNNLVKAKMKLAKLEEHIADSRKDWIEKESLRLVKNYDKIVVEDLNLKGISAFLRNAKNMNDTSWATFVAKLESKGLDYGCEVVKADRWLPSSQLCSVCGYQYKGLKLKEREWTCKNCGTHHIRDLNAAINLKNYIPQELREFTPVESSETADLAMLALQADTLAEAGRDTGDVSQKMPAFKLA